MKSFAGHNITFSLLFCLLCMTNADFAFGVSLTDGEAINKAGRQRMLSQRITKAYIQVASDVDYLRSKKQLKDGIALFEAQLQELQQQAPDDTTSRKLKSVENIWHNFKKLTNEPASNDNITKLIKKSDILLKACHDVVLLWEESVSGSLNSNVNNLVNISGKQRMLSQRIGKFYAAHYYGIKDEAIVAGLNQALAEYEGGLNTLSTAEVNNKKIKKALKKVNNRWEYSKKGLAQINQGNYVPHIISITTESMLKRMNEITGLYSQLSDETQHAQSHESNERINIPGIASTVDGEF